MFLVNWLLNLLMLIVFVVIAPALIFALIWVLQAGCKAIPIPIFCDIMQSIYGFILGLLA